MSIHSSNPETHTGALPLASGILQAGDRLGQPEFLRRYASLPALEHAELIEGVVYMGSPVSASEHGEPHGKLIVWLGTFAMLSSGVAFGDNSTIRLDLDNVPQPDGYLRIEAENGGQSRLDGGYLIGPPELIAEVAASSVSHDLHDKYRAYQRNGVREYLVWRVRDRAIDWFSLESGRYAPIATDDQGILRSIVFPGLWLNVPAMVEDRMKDVLATLEQGLKSTSR